MTTATKTHLVIGDPHCDPRFNNNRFDWLGKLIVDVKPDVIINMGDHADLSSLSGYDKGKASFHGRSYAADIESAIEGNDRLFMPMFRAKKKKPRTVILEGNHEHRIKKFLDLEPHLAGSKFGVSFSDLDYNRYYNDVVEYDSSTPGMISVDGINYAHYVVSGISGRAFSSKHHASGLTTNCHASTVVGHSHLFDYHIARDMAGKSKIGLVTGVFQDYEAPWAGSCNKLWSRGVCVLRNVENGVGDLQWISMDAVKREYS